MAHLSFKALKLCALIAPFAIGITTAAADHPRVITEVRNLGPEHALLGDQTIYLNRCIGGCTVKSGTDDASTGTSSLAAGGTHTVAESSVLNDTQWASLVQCMKDVYSPYNVTITDTLPTGQYNMEIIAGSPADIGYDAPAGVEGVAIVSSDCLPGSNLIAFTFLDQEQADDANDIVKSVCWTAAQESAHLYGLDHEYQFSDGMSACSDPMTYRTDCGGEKFFRNKFASCGEFGPARPGCGPTNSCSTTQNSHAKLLDVLGPGTPTTPPPTVAIVSPTGGTIANQGAVFATGSSVRGVTTLDLLLNGFKWTSLPGAAFGDDGQPSTEYTFTLPSAVPDGVIDIQVKATDDLGLSTTSNTVTVTKGAPCADATTCAKGQMCTAGKCFWNAPTGMLGDACTFPQACVSNECEGESTDKQFCTTDCVPGITGTCTDGYDCVPSSTTAGFCLAPDSSGGGCCSVGTAGSDGLGSMAAHGGLAAAVLAMLFWRRRRA